MSLRDRRVLYTIREVDENTLSRKVKDGATPRLIEVAVKVVGSDETSGNKSYAPEGVKPQVVYQANPDKQLLAGNPSAAQPVTNVNKTENDNASSPADDNDIRRQHQDEVHIKELSKIDTVPDKVVGKAKVDRGQKREFGPFTLTKGFLLVLAGVDFILSIPMLILGSIYYSECPGAWHLPIYLIVAGCFGLILPSFMAADILVVYPSRMTRFTTIFFWMTVVCHCAGLIMSIHLRQIQFVDKTLGNYCDYQLYHFALYISSSFVFAFIVIISVLLFVWICRSAR